MLTPLKGAANTKEKVTSHVAERNYNCKRKKMRGEKKPRRKRRKDERVFLKDKS